MATCYSIESLQLIRLVRAVIAASMEKTMRNQYANCHVGDTAEGLESGGATSVSADTPLITASQNLMGIAAPNPVSPALPGPPEGTTNCPVAQPSTWRRIPADFEAGYAAEPRRHSSGIPIHQRNALSKAIFDSLLQ